MLALGCVWLPGVDQAFLATDLSGRYANCNLGFNIRASAVVHLHGFGDFGDAPKKYCYFSNRNRLPVMPQT